uniref:Transposase n=1 Tax=Macrostomum lignano TaxID=282301 RepID=A0A1I8J0B5_9PLAT
MAQPRLIDAITKELKQQITQHLAVHLDQLVDPAVTVDNMLVDDNGKKLYTTPIGFAFTSNVARTRVTASKDISRTNDSGQPQCTSPRDGAGVLQRRRDFGNVVERSRY